MESNDPITKALNSLSRTQLNFLQNLPKAELHAHLNGSIPLPVLQSLAREREREHGTHADGLSEIVRKGLTILNEGVHLNVIDDFFSLFPAIYALTSGPEALAFVTRAVLKHFLEPAVDEEGLPVPAQCQYLELRSTPRATEKMSRRVYLDTVLDEVEKYPADTAALIVSVDRRMKKEDIQECVDLAGALKESRRRVVGVDLCGDPLAGDMNDFRPFFVQAKEAGLKTTLHIAETVDNTETDTLTLLSFGPSRLGHATFLSPVAREIVLRDRIPIEICLTSNLLCKTVKTIDAHHIRWLLEHDHPISICTDDILPFRNSLVGEYALLMAQAPYGLGLTESEIKRIAKMGFESKF
ncbi:Metallo-dependent hydrolase [Hysterangium stoloniferum]|nr:Metallo-dependent hydrolase [Hysterangium stoloniferum]